jgi:PAS domain S-box-containing protein
MITETLLTDLCGALDMVVLERRKEDVFRIIGKLPDWFAHLYPEAAVDRNAVRPGAMSAFLPYFLMDAKAFWQQRGIGWLRSGPWSEGQNADFLEAKVTCLGDREILYIQRLGPAYQEARSLLQQTREIRLDYENLLRTHEALRRSQAESRALLNAMPDSLWRISLDGGCIDLQAMGKSNRTEPAASAAQKLMDLLARHEKSQTDLLTILSQLRLATVLLDEQGKITFLSPICLRILEKSPEQLLGRPWTEICPFAEAEKARLCEMLLRPQRERSRLSVHLDIPSGRHLWLEIDVRDDPRDPRWRIVFLCDRSEVPELHRLLRERTPFRRLIGNSKPMRRI